MKLSSVHIPSIVVVLIFIAGGLLARHIVLANAAFSHAYLEYAALADDADTAAYLPTATNNPLRQELGVTLNAVLGNTISPLERVAKAQRGLELLESSRAQIDAMTAKIDAVDEAIAAMEKSLQPGDAIFQRGDPPKIIKSAKERNVATKDIRALSYRADFETGKIFSHFIDSRGILNAEYIQELNNEIPVAEAQFNNRQNRYNDMQAALNRIQIAYADFLSARVDPER